MIQPHRRLNGLPGPVLGALLVDGASFPDLPGAACVEHTALFDRTIGEGSGPTRSIRHARDKAREVCSGCPALEACGAWVRATPPFRRPAGIVAGLLVDAVGRFPADRARLRRAAR